MFCFGFGNQKPYVSLSLHYKYTIERVVMDLMKHGVRHRIQVVKNSAFKELNTYLLSKCGLGVGVGVGRLLLFISHTTK